LTADEKKDIVTMGYGHVSTSDVHVAVILMGYANRELYERVAKVVDPFVMNYVRERRGSISAEHGIGL